MPDVTPFSVNPIEAIGFLRDKLALPTQAWTDIWQDMHARAFVVAGANRDTIVTDFHNAIVDAIENGRTLEQFRSDFDDIVARHGWSYNGSRGWRSAVIFNTNLRSAYAAGRWAQIQRVKEQRPYLRYVAVLDGRTRPMHAHWHNTVLPVDHEFWKTHFPPNGWNCRCQVQSLNERDLNRYGLKVTDPPPSAPLVQKVIKTPDGPVTLDVPQGIDPGFAYNTGEAGFGRGAQRAAMEKHGKFTELTAPGELTRPLSPLPFDTPSRQTGAILKPGDEKALRAALRQALGGDDVIIQDPAGGRVQLTQAIADHILARRTRQDGREAFFPLLRELIENPAEIWVGFRKLAGSGKVQLRRRYVKVVRVGQGRTLGLVADADGGLWSGLTFFRTAQTQRSRLRTGLRIYERK